MSEKTLLVCGGRDYVGRTMLDLTLDAAVRYGGFTRMICGYNPKDRRYQGADQLAYEFCRETDTPVQCFPADWKAFGRSAGPRRNQQMADAMPDEGCAFPRADGSWGDGTLNMMGKLAAKGIPCVQITDKHPDDIKGQTLAQVEGVEPVQELHELDGSTDEPLLPPQEQSR
jgi:hypothetical protein